MGGDDKVVVVVLVAGDGENIKQVGGSRSVVVVVVWEDVH